MLNIKELENRWFTYKLKSYIPQATAALLVTLVSFIVLFFFYYDNSLKNKKTIEKKEVKIVETNDTFVKVPDKVTQPVIEPTTAPSPVIQLADIPKKNDIQKMILLPSLSFMENILSDKPEINANKTIQNDIEKIIEVKPEPIIEKIPIEENINLQIKKQNTSNDINLVIKRFKKNNNPALSLFIAKKYYELGEFNQAYNYSLITNQLNKNIEESWIIFSKSLVKLDKKETAIKILREYVTYSNSSRAEILLANILSGKFK